jgi:DNA-binding transcriptional regulator YiaG
MLRAVDLAEERIALDAMCVRLRALRLAQPDLTQVKLAALLGVSVWTLRGWELLRQYPSFFHLLQWAHVLGHQLALFDSQEGEMSLSVAVSVGAPPAQHEFARLAATLRQIRERRLETQNAVARRLEISAPTMRNWERGTGQPPRPLGFLRWADSLGLRPRLIPAIGHTGPRRAAA